MKAFFSSKLLLLIIVCLSISAILNLFFLYPNSIILRVLAIALLFIFLLAPFVLSNYLKKTASFCVGLAAGGNVVPNLLMEKGLLASNYFVLNIGKLEISSSDSSNGLLVLAAFCIFLDYLNEIGVFKFPSEKKTEKIIDIIKDSNFKTHYEKYRGFEGIEQFSNSLIDASKVSMTTASFREDLEVIILNYSSLNYLLEEILDTLRNSNFPKAIVKQLKLTRNGSLFDLLKLINTYLEEHLNNFKDQNGEIMVMLNTDEEKYLKLYSLITQLKVKNWV